jgi:hypothetical protein
MNAARVDRKVICCEWAEFAWTVMGAGWSILVPCTFSCKVMTKMTELRFEKNRDHHFDYGG